MKKLILAIVCSILLLTGCGKNQHSESVKEKEAEFFELDDTTFDYKLSKFEYNKSENELLVEYETGLPNGTTAYIGINPRFPDSWGDKYRPYFQYTNHLMQEIKTTVYNGKISYTITDDEFDNYKLPQAIFYLRVIVPMSETVNKELNRQIRTEEDFFRIYPNGKQQTVERSYSFFIRETENQIVLYDQSVELGNGNSLEEIRDSYAVLPYKELSKNADKFYEEKAEFTGEVLEIRETKRDAIDYETYLRLDVGNNDVIYIDYFSSLGMEDVFEGDVITVQGKMTGNKTYTSVAGHTITIPSMEAITYFK